MPFAPACSKRPSSAYLSTPVSGRWPFRLQVGHDVRPDTVLHEEIRLGEPDAGDDTVQRRRGRVTERGRL